MSVCVCLYRCIYVCVYIYIYVCIEREEREFPQSKIFMVTFSARDHVPAVLLFTLGESRLHVSSAQRWKTQAEQTFLGDAKENSHLWAGLEQVKQDPAQGACGRALQIQSKIGNPSLSSDITDWDETIIINNLMTLDWLQDSLAEVQHWAQAVQ